MRRAAGVLIAVVAIAVAAVWGQVHADALHAQAEEAARAQAQEALRKASIALQAVPGKAVEQAQLLAGLPALVSSSGIIPAVDGSADSLQLLANTIADALESEPWAVAWRNAGAIAVYFGPRQVYPEEQLAYAEKLLELRKQAERAGKAAGIFGYDDIGIMVGLARTTVSGPRQEPVVIALATPVDATMLAPVAQTAGATVSLHAGDGDVSAGDAVAAGKLKLAAGRSDDAPADPCCAFAPLDGATLGVFVDPAPLLDAAGTAAARDRFLSLLGAAVLAAGALFFGFRRGAKEQEQLLKETTAELQRSREELHRLSQRLSAPGMATGHIPSAGESGDVGLDRTRASVSSGRYMVVAPLGEGGMARVSVAEVKGAEGFRRLFVVKRLRPELAGNQELVNQFIDEARLGASLVHSNIVPVFDFGRDAEGYYLAQEFILGRDVDTVLQASRSRRGKPLEPELVSYLGVEALKALAYAHTLADSAGQPLGLVHRDVSPNNLMVSRRGELKLLDFGIVKSQGRVTRTQTGVVKGNLFFMSPEQAQALDVDHRSDLFSLAMCLFTAATGETLYSGSSSYELLIRAGAGPTAVDRQRIAALPHGLGPVLQRALELDPARRYPTAEAFAQALAAACPPATSADMARLMDALVGDQLAADEQRLAMRAEA